MALTIGTGFVVDDAIVMIENIVRHMEDGEQPMRGGAEGRQRDRLHRDLADGVADRGVHPAAVHDRAGRPHVPRIRADADDRGRGLGDRLADADADDVLAAAAARRRGDDGAGSGAPSAAASTAWSSVYRRTLVWVLRHQRATLLVTVADHRRDRLCSTSIVPKGFLPLQDTGLDHGGDGGRPRRLLRRDAAPAGRGRRPRSRPIPMSTAWSRWSASGRSTRRPMSGAW